MHLNDLNNSSYYITGAISEIWMYLQRLLLEMSRSKSSGKKGNAAGEYINILHYEEINICYETRESADLAQYSVTYCLELANGHVGIIRRP